MPGVNVRRDDLFAKIGRQFTKDEFANLCFEFGIELDGEFPESEHKKDTTTPDAVWYKIDVPANRYDVLCIEGLARALRIFLKDQKTPEYVVCKPTAPLKLVQDETTLSIRPFVVAAVLRGVEMNQKIYDSFIDLQDKLHFNLGRRRTLVAIGTHDLDLIQGPFKYTAQKYQDIKFVALNESKEMDVSSLFTYYREEKSNSHLKPYLDIAAAAQPGVAAADLLHPVIYDARGKVLSLPPVINSEYSKISLQTKNIFIECTATDYTKANIVLNMIVAMFSEYCATPFQVEAVDIESPATLPLPPVSPLAPVPTSTSTDSSKLVLTYPTMASLHFETDSDYLVAGIGKITIPAEEICPLLARMQLVATLADNSSSSSSTSSSTAKKIKVVVPPTRCDILHPIDIQEDVAIAYGYNNIPRTMPPVVTVGAENPLNKLTDQVRGVVAQARFTEVVTWVLIRTEENFEKLRRPEVAGRVVTLANSKTDFTACRTTVIPGLLKVVAANKADVLPIRIFEAGDVVVLDKSRAEGARNERHVGLLYAGSSSGISEVHGMLDKVMQQLGATFLTLPKFTEQYPEAVKNVTLAGSHLTGSELNETKTASTSTSSASSSSSSSTSSSGMRRPKAFTIREATLPEGNTFLKGRGLEVIVDSGLVIGFFGIVHPEVLENFELGTHCVCSVLELNIEPFL